MRGWSSRGAAVQWLTVAVLILVLMTLARLHPDWFGLPDTRYPEAPPRMGAYSAIDGDSFRLGRREIRLHGIDAPEYRQTCSGSNGSAIPCGKMARDALSRMIGTAALTCRLVERDRYRREVSRCMAGPLDLNREMVRQGWAMAYRRHAHDYVSAEAEARAAKRGIWAWRFDRPEDWRNRNRNLHGSLTGAEAEDTGDE
ncbi:MAG: thermonuclease family protein [Rhizobiales bacterium]|nr:thermonuclease family protein [Hyphomicrobiales bacterium]